MMVGHVETIADRIEHLERLRAQQDKSLGYQKGHFHRVHLLDLSGRAHEIKSPDRRCARIPAHRRRYRESISITSPNVQSSWVTQGLEIGQVALKYGANDLGSIMIEENVVSAGRLSLSE